MTAHAASEPTIDEEVVAPQPILDSAPADDYVEPDDEQASPTDRVRSGDDEPEDELEELQPKTLPAERVLWSQRRSPDGSPGAVERRTYVQAPIQYFPKIELYGILGRAVKIVLEADTGVDVETLMGMANPKRVINQLAARLPGAEDAPLVEAVESQQREMDALKILAAFAEVVSIAPDLLKEAYCVILNVPTGHREWAINHAMVNLSDEEGFDILETFIDQSWDAVEGFFTQWLPRVARRTVQARQNAEAKRRSAGIR